MKLTKKSEATQKNDDFYNKYKRVKIQGLLKLLSSTTVLKRGYKQIKQFVRQKKKTKCFLR